MSNDELQLGKFIVLHREDDIGDRPLNYCEDVMCDASSESSKTKERLAELLKYRDKREMLADISGWTPPKFPVSGYKLAEAGINKGPAFAKVLQYLRQKWKESRYMLGERELLEFVDEAKKSS